MTSSLPTTEAPHRSARATRDAVAIALLISLVGKLVVGIVAYVARALWLIARARGGLARVAARTASALAPVSLLTWAFGNPLGSSRSFVAFAQHYAFDVTRRERLPIDPWLNYETIIARDFGPVTTVAQALFANPLAILRHALFNVRELPGNMLDLVALRASVTQPGSVPMLAASAVLLVILTLALVARLVRFSRTRAQPRALTATLAVFAFACASCMPGTILVFPRAHYLVAPCGLGALLALWSVDDALARYWPRVRERADREFVVSLALAAALSLIVPSARASTPSPMPVREAAHALRALRLQRATILELGPGFAAFAGYDYPTLSVWQKHEPWGTFLERNDVGIVVARDRYLTRNAFAEDPAMGLWLASPERFGFCEVYANPNFLRAFAKRGALEERDRERHCRP